MLSQEWLIKDNTVPVAHLRQKDNPNAMLHLGTLQNMLEVAEDSESDLVLSLLECSMGDLTTQPPPRFSALASNERAYAGTKGEFLIGNKHFTDELFWTATAHRHGSSWIHMQDEGFCTAVQVKTGGNLWELARRKEQNGSSHIGDMGSAQAYTGDWEAYRGRVDGWEYEGVLLTPGSVL